MFMVLWLVMIVIFGGWVRRDIFVALVTFVVIIERVWIHEILIIMLIMVVMFVMFVLMMLLIVILVVSLVMMTVIM